MEVFTNPLLKTDKEQLNFIPLTIKEQNNLIKNLIKIRLINNPSITPPTFEELILLWCNTPYSENLIK